jgi:CHAD domain-containing protein
MAKPRDIPDLGCEEPFAAAAAKVVAVRAQELADHSENVLDTSDIERVHDMRVATRRLRAVLEIFAPCFPKAEHRDVLRDVKALADALGERRDPDVHIAALEGFAAAAAPSSRPGVRLLIGRFRDEQAEANQHLSDALDEMERSDLAGRLRGLVELAAA